jgi:hypothetical protein
MSITPSEAFQVIFTIVGALISLLLMGNLFFLKKLVQKVDVIDSRMQKMRIELVKLKVKIFGARHEGNGECDDMEDEELMT